MASTELQLRNEVTEMFFQDMEQSDEKVVVETAILCQRHNISPQNLFWKWEALSFNSGSIRSGTRAQYTLDSVSLLKETLEREWAANKMPTRAKGLNAVANAPRTRFPKAMSNSLPIVASLSRSIRSDKLGVQVKSERSGAVATTSRVVYKGPKTDPLSKGKRAYRYMYEKVSERSEALDDRIDEFAELIREHYNISELGDPGSSADGEMTVVGRITLDSESTSTGPVKLNEATLTLESSRMMGSGARISLRFEPQVKIRGGTRGTAGIGLFPGAIVALRGKNGGGGWLLVSEILVMPPLKSSPESLGMMVNPEQGDTSFSMCIASGPYTPDGDLQYKPWHNLTSKLKAKKPAVLLLLGPFIDISNSRIRDGDLDDTPSQLFHRQFTNHIRDFLDISPASVVLIIPSIRDIISSHAVFPQSELDFEFAEDPRVHLLPNPCRFTLNGVSFAASSVDVLFHLRKEEYLKRGEVEAVPAGEDDPGTDAMATLCRHLLQQRSFYPIFPVPLDLAHEVNLDVTHAVDGLKICGDGDDEFAPDVLVVPSRLKQFSKIVDNTVVVNPSFLMKGSYSMLNFEGQGTTPVKNRIKAELLKPDETVS